MDRDVYRGLIMSDPNTSPEPRNGGNDFREIATHVAITAVFGLALVVVAGFSSDPLQTALIVAAPVVVLVGAISMLVRTYRVYRRGGRWQLWQGGSWFLLAFFIVMLFGSAPALFE
ncbi:hypothetical protein GP2_019_00120 [Gordonia paraffinivorans NBRC 108238]|uniref:DUF3017 domain-containing protein n=3 Tax=Gordonia paraffinivorans TaxID=175628 RepID=A0ABQ0IKU1_9ACTN|nr:hypothetical protein GP2_019_00120 [Gordonia paraffinivorans NBRC 108238]VFA90132.1 Uncharacterised protein [Gordonia paraffinivorans]